MSADLCTLIVQRWNNSHQQSILLASSTTHSHYNTIIFMVKFMHCENVNLLYVILNHLKGAETATGLMSLLKKASAHTDPCPTAT